MADIVSVRTLLREPDSYLGRSVVVNGFVRTRRDSKGGFSFMEINDGSTVKNIQAVIPAALPNYNEQVLKAGTGASVSVSGVVVASQGKGQSVEISAESLIIHGFADPDFPLQKKHHTLEFLRQITHLRPRTNVMGCVARVRSRLALGVHNFFQSRGFHYVHTPIITASDCEGAGQMFRVTTLKPGEVDFSQDFFGKMAHLTVSGQLEGECYATALGQIYTFGPTFRAENSHTSRHLSEFWMIEPEASFMDLAGNMKLAEDFIKHLVVCALDECSDEVNYFDEKIAPGLKARLSSIAISAFKSITYTEAVDILKKSGESFAYPVEWGSDLQSEHERYLTEKTFNGPVIVTDYPRNIKAFYMRQNDDGKTVRAMDVLVPGVGEIIGGSQREERADVLEARIREMGFRPEDYAWYLDLRKYGTVPHAGFGLGFERFIQYVTGLENIRDVIPFPRTPGNA
ncbi:MAG: asparagine--tRNA ligase [Fibrobacteres bacterium]|nr:asparagine--tRNA ligase [Fibrobacterota bacterium]